MEAWGSPTFRVKNKLFAMFAAADTHHGEGRPGLWLKTTSENQQLMLQFAPKRFYYPAYVGKSGWMGVFLDAVCDWDELADLMKDAYVMTAPKRIAAKLAERDTPVKPQARKATARKATTKKKGAR